MGMYRPPVEPEGITVPKPGKLRFMYGAFIRISDATQFVKEFNEEVKLEEPVQYSELCVEINGFQLHMTLEEFIRQNYEPGLADRIIAGETKEISQMSLDFSKTS